MHMTAVDDAAWTSPWRTRRVSEKVWFALALVLTALLAPTWPGCALVALVSIVAICGPARIPVRVLVTVMAAPICFIAIGAVPVALSISRSGVALGDWPTALGLVAHGLAGTLALMLLATTTPMVDLLSWLRTLHVPDALIEIASLMYRMLWVLLASALTIHEAQQARLGDAPQGPHRWRRRLATSADAISAVLVRSWMHATRLEDGLAGRGYESSLRTLEPVRTSSRRFVVLAAGCTAAIWTICWAVTR